MDIENVSCYLKSSSEMDHLELIALTPPSTVAGSATLVPVFVDGTPVGEYIYAANNTVSMTGRPGQAFVLIAETTGKFVTVACQISGQFLQF